MLGSSKKRKRIFHLPIIVVVVVLLKKNENSRKLKGRSFASVYFYVFRNIPLFSTPIPCMSNGNKKRMNPRQQS